MKFRITILCENSVGPISGTLGEHGFSALIELSQGEPLLFDTGQGLTLFHNARRMNKDLLLDVRTPQENSQARLPGSVLIPIDKFEGRIKEVPKNKTILVYCAVGSRSKPVAEYLSKNGYKDVYNMTDGIVGWYRNGYIGF